MTAKLTASLRQAPATVPALAAMALFVVWATDQAGYPVTHWAPGALLVLALLVLAVAIVGLRPAAVGRPVRIALAALAAYTALSFLSILWAGVPGDAWEGANRTLLYLIVFALFACWPQRGSSAALLLGGWALAMIALAGFALLHIGAAGARELQSLLPGGRLVYPSGYPNANAAQWLMAFWPALLLARSERLPWGLRGLLAGGAVLLAEVALLSQSRGSLYATPVMLILVFALLPGRTRTFALLVPVAAGVAAAAPAVLRVGDHLSGGAVTSANVHGALLAAFAASLVVGAVVALGAAVETRHAFSEGARARIRRGLTAVAIATLVAVLAGGLVAAGDPVTRIRSAWHSFKGGYGSNTTGTRLVSGLGSNRYDFYRVALDEFAAHPLVGIGTDNFQQQYLAHGRSSETPRYPHSVELRALTETGLVGTLLLVVGIVAALVGGGSSLRRADPLARAVAAAALGGFAYWLVHGSFDWFWEFAGLGAPAFAMLGLACALAPVARAASATGPALAPGAAPAPGTGAAAGERAGPARGGVGARVGVIAGVLVALAIAASLTAPWLSQLEVEQAARIWTRAPRAAYARLDDAAGLNPLSDEAYLVAGSIALRYGELARADHEFSLALARTPADAYATLERGAIASMRGERAAALVLLARAAHLNPRDALAAQALDVARRGGRVNIDQLNRLILLKAQQLA
ncbi:MAG TPA: O-antigen ligase family protein [Solirubrobacteraceae bacterium]|nr:O-antigen ligase family protein [Solirubrobacteraceae bacterium]